MEQPPVLGTTLPVPPEELPRIFVALEDPDALACIAQWFGRVVLVRAASEFESCAAIVLALPSTSDAIARAKFLFQRDKIEALVYLWNPQRKNFRIMKHDELPDGQDYECCGGKQGHEPFCNYAPGN